MGAIDQETGINVADVRRRFDLAAAGFDTADFVHEVARDGLLARLDPMLVEPRVVVDLGAATGAGSRLLARRFRRARVIAVDLSHKMLERLQRKRSWLSRISAVQADARRLPFADASVDLVFASLLLPWIDAPASLFLEIGRVLRSEGVLLFSTLGPDSLGALRRAWQKVDEHAHVNRFVDMHDLGDALVHAGFADPVLDVDRLTVTYTDADALFRDLTATGARNSLTARNPALVSRGRFGAMRAALDKERQDRQLCIDLELIFGHCWGAAARASAHESRFPANGIRRRGG